MRSVLVTGATRGLGLEIARRLVADGYRVVGLARAPTPAFEALGPAAAFEAADLSDLAGLAPLAARLRAAHGPVWGLVANAGSSVEGLLARTRDVDIERLVALNLVSPMLLTKHVSKGMLAAGEGRIVLVASIVAATGYAGLSAYAATKAGLVGFARSLAREIGPARITVNAIAPGFVETELTRGLSEADLERIRRRSALRRLPAAAEVAAAAAFLLSEGAAGTTGTVLTVDAGQTA